MLHILLGGAALSAIGYGVSKILTDEDFRDDIKAKISNTAIKAYEKIQSIEEEVGLNEFEIPVGKESSGTTSSKEKL